ncbi:histidine kinase [Pseudoalteromonas sp. GCY]|uniref:sensor histidine kinase n=1 Tax=Pseudoalteromonas sp. GCY TaxID=2003316 RepID=UPI000BFF0DF5|nr:ATP-binding protein [Pseudoalteromonas sp. GCY]PHI36388.1 histidine kinase [Pseudoalteromonas sp. GCY]QQQ65356.1 GHKL domain-containing protein [Pseudoalteromonas sp. GCY]
MTTSQQHALIIAISIIIGLIPLWFLLDDHRGFIAIVLGSVSVSLVLYKLLMRENKAGWEALEVGLMNFKDGEFSTSITYNANNELGRLCQLFNETAKQLRDEKQWIYQRELMLDKVLESSPQVLVLVDSQGVVVFANNSAKTFFNCEHRLEGERFSKLLSKVPGELQQAASNQLDGLFSIQNSSGESQMWHLANGELLLNNHFHKLYIFKQFTRELSRQEVQVWKKVIRIISHELNNSLGPISSMLHSGQILAERVDEPRLSRVFATIEERIVHLSEFVQGYGKFAKLPQPNIEPVDLQVLCERLQSHWSFQYQLNQMQLQADTTQLEQLLINLIKNATESGSEIEEICVQSEQRNDEAYIWVLDRGEGMSDTVMANALIPFYSTKASGTGLGLALCREIVEAHNGQISLYNREGKGLCVEILLPNKLP